MSNLTICADVLPYIDYTARYIPTVSADICQKRSDYAVTVMSGVI